MAYEIVHDGGSRNNQTPEKRQGYGSMKAFFNGRAVEMTVDQVKYAHYKVTFGRDTNNVAEYKMAIIALDYAVQLLGKLSTAQLAQVGKIIFRTDSKLVIDQLSGHAKCKSETLQPLCHYAQELFAIAPEIFEYQHMDGDEVKSILGH